MELVEGHLILQQCPPKFGLIVNEGYFLELLRRRNSCEGDLGSSSIYNIHNTYRLVRPAS